MWQIILVGAGGFVGSILRYLVSGWVQGLLDRPTFGCGTLSVNVLGCLAIGLLGGWADNAGLLGPSAPVPARWRAGRFHDVLHVRL